MKKLLILGALALILVSCNNNAQEAKMNVLFVVVDDLNTTLGCYDHPLVKTPNVDQLASEGLLFNHAYCNYAVCGPSRSSFMMGQYPQTVGVLDNRTPLESVRNGKLTLPSLFRKNGYYTMSIGKTFHRGAVDNDPGAWDEEYKFKTNELGRQGEGRNLTDGVLKWCNWLSAEGEDEDHEDGMTAAKAIEFIKSEHEKPFFLAVGLAKPHDPFHAPKKYFDLYDIEECDPPVLPEDWNPVYKHSLPSETKTFDKFTDKENREFLHSYYACTSFMDAQLGKIMSALDESGLRENTLVVFFGDHGYHLGEHRWWNKVTIYQKGHVAPMIVCDPRVEKTGVKTDAMIEFVDIYPTLAELVALDSVPEAQLEGQSFAGVIADPELTHREYVSAVVRRGPRLGKTVKTKDWRYIQWDEGALGEELYDQHKDPIEYHNLAEDETYSAVIEEMKALLEN